ncbi:metal-dependent transcriptional regulator [Candidatus Electronema sp. TJ]|uniref:metal-dependent transcriptional regulator n=1 Tax=Candidatus Electronema sp. TJ TaxID=3401573 RepID=UPI003AA81FFB
MKKQSPDSQDRLSASQEDYLEAIYHISVEKMAARAKDIAEYLDVRASSVTGALRLLGKMGLVNYAPYDLITLTEQGCAAAEEIVRRHKALKNFFVKVLGIDIEEADEAACKMEHSVSKNIVGRLVKYSEYIEQCPGGGIAWEGEFGGYCKKHCVGTACRLAPGGQRQTEQE